MRKFTVSVDDETYRRARLKAEELDTSVSRLVRDFLRELTREVSEFDRLRQLESEMRDRVTEFQVSDRLSREEAHERRG